MRSERKKLTPDLSEDAGWDAWEEHLMEVDREELVQLLLTRMSSDPGFMRFMYLRYGGNRFREDEMGDRIRMFREAVLEEMMGPEPDAEYLVSMSERCFDLCAGLEGAASSVRLLLAVVLTLDEVLCAERFGDEDSLLLEDSIRDAVRMIRKIPVKGKLTEEAAKICRREKTRMLLKECMEK